MSDVSHVAATSLRDGGAVEQGSVVVYEPSCSTTVWGTEYTTALDAIKSVCGCDLAWRPHAVYQPKVFLSPELTASSAASLGKVTQSPHSDVAWLEPRRYCWVPVAAKVASSDASPKGDEASNVAVASHGSPTWTGAIHGTVPEAQIIGAAAYLLHTPPPSCTVHVVDASIIGAHLRRAHEALYYGIKGPTSHLVNQQALSWIVEGLRRLPRRLGGPHHWVVRQSSQLAAVPLEAPDSAAARAMAPSVHLVVPKEHAILLVPGGDGELEPRVPSMQALQLVREMEWRSLAARTRAHTPLASACEAVPLGAVHHGRTHGNMLRARDGRLSTMQVMRRWRQKLTRVAIPAHPCIFCGGPEEDIGHMRLLCARDEEVARLLCRRVEEFTAELPLRDRAVEFMAWREHGCKWTESLMAGVVPGDLKRLFAAVRAASSRGPAKAKLFVEEMIQVGENVYAAGTIGSPRSCSRRCKIEGEQCMRSCEVTHPSSRRRVGSDGIRHGTRSTASPTTCRRPFRGHRCMRCWCPGRTSRTRRPCPRSPPDGGGGAGLQPVAWFLDDSGLPCVQGVVPRGIGAVLGHGAWHHGEGP